MKTQATLTLQLRGSSSAFAEDLDEDILTLEAGAVPLAWLSLLTEADLGRPDFWEGSRTTMPVSWADQVRSAFTAPDLETIPPLEVSWPVARVRLRSAVAGLQARNDPWAGPLAEWEEQLAALAAQGPVQRVVLDLEEAAAQFGDADAFLGELLGKICWWFDPDGLDRPQVASEAELTGDPVEEAPVWQAGRRPPVVPAQPRPPRSRGVDPSLVVSLSTVTLMTYWLTASVWWAGAATLSVVAGITWSVFRQAKQQPRSFLALPPVSRPVTVRPPLLSVLICALLLLGGLLELWGQLHRVRGLCCSRAYSNYWPSRSWTELWVIGAFVMLGVVSQTVRLRGSRVTVTWLLGLLRLSRPLAQVTVEAVELTTPRTQERVAGLRLRVGWLGVTVTQEQTGYAALRDACTERVELD